MINIIPFAAGLLIGQGVTKITDKQYLAAGVYVLVGIMLTCQYFKVY